MGASGSRRLTVRNDEPRIIQVSEDVIKRLKTSSSGQAFETTETGGAKPISGGALTFNQSGYPVIETIGALQVRQEKDEELRSNDAHWRSKLRELETRYISSALIAEGEFSEELDKLNKMMPRPKKAVCQEAKGDVAKCYSEHPNETLRCADVVMQFATCVQQNTKFARAPSA